MALKGKQKNIDANKDGRISGEDFKILRSRQHGGMKKKMGGGMMRPMMANKGEMADKKKSKFLQRRMTLGGGRLAIPLLIGLGVSKAAKKFLKKRDVGKFPYVKPKKKMGGGLMAATKKLKSQGKMGGGMMMKPIMANEGTKIDLNKRNKSFFSGFSKVFEGPSDREGFGSGKRYATIGGVKPKLTRSDRRKRRTFKSLQEMRTAKGFRPGETPKQFNKRKELAKFVVEKAKATRLGKIVLPIALAGAGAVQYLKSKMNKNKPDKKMGGGMMNMPGYKKGKSVMAKGCKLGRKKPTKMYT